MAYIEFLGLSDLKLPGKKSPSVTLSVQTAIKHVHTLERLGMMYSNILIDDNFLSNEEISNLNALITRQQAEVYWTFSTYTATEDDNRSVAFRDGLTYDSHQMIHNIDDSSPLHEAVMSMFEKFVNKHDISVDKILRCKANMLSRTLPENITKHHLAHVDTNIKHMVFLYYINDSDGATTIFNEVYNGMPIKSLSTASRIDPKAGRGVLFDGRHLHSSSSPIASEHRMVVNIVFTEVN
jgi:hypothetical protein